MKAYFYLYILLAGLVACGGGSNVGTSNNQSDSDPAQNDPGSPVGGSSVNFIGNAGDPHEYGQQTTIPAGFGEAEFTLQLWIKPDHSYPVGSTAGTTGNKSNNWTSEDYQPFSANDWWWLGNFLLDGHNNNTFQNGTFSLQVYGGGRVRWLVGDGSPDLIAVQVYPATDTESLLDGNWHQLTLIRRWQEVSSAQFELWVDGNMVASSLSNNRTDMRRYWDNWEGFTAGQPGWYWGAEKNAVQRGHVYEDYKGLLDEIRFWSRALSDNEIRNSYNRKVIGNESGLVGVYHFDEGSGIASCNRLNTNQCINLQVPAQGWTIWQDENSPIYE